MGPWRRAYYTEAKRKSRAAQRAAELEGRPQPHSEAVREALADAALIILAVNAPGHDEIVRLVCAGFPAHAGLALQLRAKARSGRLKPRRLTPSVIAGLLQQDPPVRKGRHDDEH